MKQRFVHWATNCHFRSYWLMFRAVDKVVWKAFYMPGWHINLVVRNRMYERDNPGVTEMGQFPWEKANGRSVRNSSPDEWPKLYLFSWRFALRLMSVYSRFSRWWVSFWQCDCLECASEEWSPEDCL